MTETTATWRTFGFFDAQSSTSSLAACASTATSQRLLISYPAGSPASVTTAFDATTTSVEAKSNSSGANANSSTNSATLHCGVPADACSAARAAESNRIACTQQHSLCCSACLAGDDLLVLGDEDGYVHGVDSLTGAAIWHFEAYTHGPVTHMKYISAHGGLLVTLGDDGVNSTRAGGKQPQQKQSPYYASSSAQSHDGNRTSKAAAMVIGRAIVRVWHISSLLTRQSDKELRMRNTQQRGSSSVTLSERTASAVHPPSMAAATERVVAVVTPHRVEHRLFSSPAQPPPTQTIPLASFSNIFWSSSSSSSSSSGHALSPSTLSYANASKRKHSAMHTGAAELVSTTHEPWLSSSADNDPSGRYDNARNTKGKHSDMGTAPSTLATVVVAWDVSREGQYAVIGLTNGTIVVLCGALEEPTHRLHIHRLRSRIACGELTNVALPPLQHVYLDSLVTSAAASTSSALPYGASSGVFRGFTSRGEHTNALASRDSAEWSNRPQLLYTVYDDAVTVWALPGVNDAATSTSVHVTSSDADTRSRRAEDYATDRGTASTRAKTRAMTGSVEEFDCAVDGGGARRGHSCVSDEDGSLYLLRTATQTQPAHWLLLSQATTRHEMPLQPPSSSKTGREASTAGRRSQLYNVHDMCSAHGNSNRHAASNPHDTDDGEDGCEDDGSGSSSSSSSGDEEDVEQSEAHLAARKPTAVTRFRCSYCPCDRVHDNEKRGYHNTNINSHNLDDDDCIVVGYDPTQAQSQHCVLCDDAPLLTRRAGDCESAVCGVWAHKRYVIVITASSSSSSIACSHSHAMRERMSMECYDVRHGARALTRAQQTTLAHHIIGVVMNAQRVMVMTTAVAAQAGNTAPESSGGDTRADDSHFSATSTARVDGGGGSSKAANAVATSMSQLSTLHAVGIIGLQEISLTRQLELLARRAAHDMALCLTRRAYALAYVRYAQDKRRVGEHEKSVATGDLSWKPSSVASALTSATTYAASKASSSSAAAADEAKTKALRVAQSSQGSHAAHTRMNSSSSKDSIHGNRNRESYDSSVLELVALQELLQRSQQRYADHLYESGQRAAALTAYIATRHFLEPAHVIRRYCDGSACSQRLLARYLESLYHQNGHDLPRHCSSSAADGLAARYSVPLRSVLASNASASSLPLSIAVSTEHATLLLQCYIQLGNTAALQAFVHRKDVRFDVSTALALCRAAHLFSAALHLAKRFARSLDYVDIQLYDRHAASAALQHIAVCGVDVAECVMRRVGQRLLRESPRATTELLILLCTRWKGPARRGRAAAAAAAVEMDHSNRSGSTNTDRVKESNRSVVRTDTTAMRMEQDAERADGWDRQGSTRDAASPSWSCILCGSSKSHVDTHTATTTRATETLAGAAAEATIDFDSVTSMCDYALHPHRCDADAMLPIFVDAPVCLLYFLRAVIASGVLTESAAPSTAETAGTRRVALRNAVLYHILFELYLTKDLRYSLRPDVFSNAGIRDTDGSRTGQNSSRSSGSSGGGFDSSWDDDEDEEDTGAAGRPKGARESSTSKKAQTTRPLRQSSPGKDDVFSTGRSARDDSGDERTNVARLTDSQQRANYAVPSLEQRQDDALALLLLWQHTSSKEKDAAATPTPPPYDTAAMLCLCYRFGFDRGVTWLLTRLQRWRELIAYYTSVLSTGGDESCTRSRRLAAVKGLMHVALHTRVAAAENDLYSPNDSADGNNDAATDVAARTQSASSSPSLRLAKAPESHVDADGRDGGGAVCSREEERLIWIATLTVLLQYQLAAVTTHDGNDDTNRNSCSDDEEEAIAWTTLFRHLEQYDILRPEEVVQIFCSPSSSSSGSPGDARTNHSPRQRGDDDAQIATMSDTDTEEGNGNDGSADDSMTLSQDECCVDETDGDVDLTQQFDCAPTLHSGAIRDFVQRAIHAVQHKCAQARAHQRMTLLGELQALRSYTHRLRTHATHLSSAHCAQCSMPLSSAASSSLKDVPIVHFACGHTFHAHCLDDMTECNRCAAQQRVRLAAESARLSRWGKHSWGASHSASFLVPQSDNGDGTEEMDCAEGHTRTRDADARSGKSKEDDIRRWCHDWVELNTSNSNNSNSNTDDSKSHVTGNDDTNNMASNDIGIQHVDESMLLIRRGLCAGWKDCCDGEALADSSLRVQSKRNDNDEFESHSTTEEYEDDEDDTYLSEEEDDEKTRMDMVQMEIW